MSDTVAPVPVRAAATVLLLRETVDALARAEQMTGQCDELIAEELRIAARALGRLTGRVDVEDLLDVIFREFCIGK